MILTLSIILFILLILIGGTRGFKAFICFYLNYILIILYIRLMGLGISAIILAIIFSLIAGLISLFILNGINKKTISSYLSILIVLALTLIMVSLITINSNIGGFSYESLENIGAYSLDINYSMVNVLIGMYILSTIGTVIDTSISISSALNEVYENNKDLSVNELYKSGMNIGKDILSTTINTLYFAFLGGFIAFILWHHKDSASFIINYKAFIQDALELLFCFISSILIIPITSYMTSKRLKKEDS